MVDELELVVGEEVVDEWLVGDGAVDESESVVGDLAASLEVLSLDAGVVVRVEWVEDDDVVVRVQEPFGHVGADETRAAGH